MNYLLKDEPVTEKFDHKLVIFEYPGFSVFRS